jgi:hypothetical protein
MKEEFLHYVWQYKKFAFSRLRTVQGESLQILDIGNSLQQSGPDFFNARIILDNQKWAGNVEIHLKSSDWYLHHHERDSHYDNVILHVVWKHDAAVFRKDNSEIPVLELCHYVSSDLIHEYQKLQTRKSWINCENDIKTISKFLMQNWNERLFFERLERKVKPITALLEDTENDWEAAFFCFLAKNFGLNVNGEAFYEIARSIPFQVVRKESFDVQYLEALFFGQAGFLKADSQDNYVKELKELFDYLSIKYQLEKDFHFSIEFFRLRPDNFPTIRLAQLAMLYHSERHLFSKIIAAKSLPEFYVLFDISVSEYWEQHYNFEKSSKLKDKSLSKSFVDLLIINTVIPFKFAYDMFLGKDVSEDHVRILQKIMPENNSVISKFKDFGIEAVNAFETQSLLQLKNVYCDKNRCLECVIGMELLKN